MTAWKTKLPQRLSDELAALVEKYPDTKLATHYSKELAVVVERDKARFSSWYETFSAFLCRRTGASWNIHRLRTMPAVRRHDGL